MTISCLSDQLRRDEADRQYAYDDTDGIMLGRGMTLQGNLTIGVGHNLSANGLSQKIRDIILDDDIRAATVSLEAYIPWVMGLDSVRQGVLLNMVFNMGIKGLAGFTETLENIKSSNYETAKQSMLKSKWAKQVGKRADRLALQMQNGIWQ